MQPVNDPINHPSHYTAHPSGVECIEVTRSLPFTLGNAVKYLWRSGKKGPAIEDLRKAAWYLNDFTQHNDCFECMPMPVHWPKVAEWALHSSPDGLSPAILHVLKGDIEKARCIVAEEIERMEGEVAKPYPLGFIPGYADGRTPDGFKERAQGDKVTAGDFIYEGGNWFLAKAGPRVGKRRIITPITQ